MILPKWESLPSEMKNASVKEYYVLLQKKKTALVFKRIFDIVVASILLILISPILLALAILIKVDSEGPVFYRQERVTTANRVFKIFKFRTMVQNADKIGSLVTVSNDSRITRIGNKIRKCRLDEVPQLLNIIRGEMTFVGIRPEVRKYVERYSAEMMSTLLLPAGVTSLASIMYKDEDEIIGEHLDAGESLDDIYVNHVLPGKMKYNLEYLKTFSFFGDIKLMVKTVFSVLK